LDTDIAPKKLGAFLQPHHAKAAIAGEICESFRDFKAAAIVAHDEFELIFGNLSHHFNLSGVGVPFNIIEGFL
jgi:hypothetical protein